MHPRAATVGSEWRRAAWTALAVNLLSTGVALAQASSGGDVLEARPPKAIADFRLTDQNGKPFGLTQVRGGPVLLFFGFTHCPDACPRALSQLQAVSRRADPALRSVRVVMVSIDGERDTPAAMKRYLLNVSPKFIGLTGDPKKVAAIAAQFSAVFFKGLPADKSGNYLVEHTTQIYLLDASGRLRSTFFDAPTDTLARITAVVAKEKG